MWLYLNATRFICSCVYIQIDQPLVFVLCLICESSDSIRTSYTSITSENVLPVLAFIGVFWLSGEFLLMCFGRYCELRGGDKGGMNLNLPFPG